MKPQKISLPKSIIRKWHQIDASSAPMGRLATEIANRLRGKHKRDFTPHLDMGDFVVAVNVERLKFTGKKAEQKKYFRHSGYLGGIKSESLKTLLAKNPGEVLRRGVMNMIDDVKFRKTIMPRLKLVKGESHNFKIDYRIQLPNYKQTA